MIQELVNLYEKTRLHKQEHACGGVPYEYGDVLRSIVASIKPKSILELGTGLGYTAACMALGSTEVYIETIDKDESHMELAKKEWEALGVSDRITPVVDFAENVFPRLSKHYDLIFFDGNAPQMKFLLEFEKLLKPYGLLITANLFLQDPKGGTYLRQLMNERKWITGVFADTAISTKIFS